MEIIESFITIHFGNIYGGERLKLYRSFIHSTLSYLKMKEIPQTPLQVVRHVKHFDKILELNFPGYSKSPILPKLVLGREPEF